VGRGRNSKALLAAGLTVVAVEDAAAASKTPFNGVEGSFEAVISTHGFLHGIAVDVAARLDAIAHRLESQGLLYATFGSTRDARFGEGRRIDNSTFAPTAGDERGVAHAYFDRHEIGTMLQRHFEIESLDEHVVDDVAGRWAHSARPLDNAVHWFVKARKR
jgi:hypothetical protein